MCLLLPEKWMNKLLSIKKTTQSKTTATCKNMNEFQNYIGQGGKHHSTHAVRVHLYGVQGQPRPTYGGTVRTLVGTH